LEESLKYLHLHYGSSARLQKEPNGKYKFVNVPPIANFPSTFKTIQKAMNCLIVHENGYMKWKKDQRKNNRNTI
jgi:hypothetical protein